MPLKLILILTLVTLIPVFLLYSNSGPSIKVNEQLYYIELANTPQKTQKGLMHRKNLCKDCGMLFIFNQEKHHNFWMKNTLIPLDIVFMDQNLKIIDLHHAELCQTKNCHIYTSQKKAKYVLEVNYNSFNQNILNKKAILKK